MGRNQFGCIDIQWVQYLLEHYVGSFTIQTEFKKNFYNQIELTFFYPTRTYKRIRRIERYCSSLMGLVDHYLFKYVVKEKDGWYHVLECIGKKKENWKCHEFRRHMFRHYIIPYYDHYQDNPVVSLLGGRAPRYNSLVNVNLSHKKYHVTTYQYNRR